MGTEWTKEQSLAITENGSNILVAAAAGSGKTTVLVERIIRKIIDENIDIYQCSCLRNERKNIKCTI